MDLEEELRGLYAGVPDGFVAARNALVKRLKAEKRAGEAATIGKLRRPSRVAWALNAAVAGDPGLGERVREAVDGLDGADDVRAANAALREASDALVSAARDAAREGGHALERGDLMPAALAVVGDPEALDDLLAVRLEDVPSGGGFGAFGFGVPDAAPSRRDRPAAAATRPKAKGKATTTKPRAGKGGTTQDDAAALAEAQAEAEREAARADARRALEEAEAEAEEAEAALAGAERALVSATADAEEAAERLREVQRAAEEADARRADSERAVGEAQRRYQDSERAVRTSRKALDDLR